MPDQVSPRSVRRGPRGRSSRPWSVWSVVWPMGRTTTSPNVAPASRVRLTATRGN